MEQRQYLITVKLPPHYEHDPNNPVRGICPIGKGDVCSDITGQYHTLMVTADSIDAARDTVLARFDKIVRIEGLS